LRAPPRNYDWLFGVNAALIVLAFSIFGSRFVLSPGLGIGFALPTVPADTTELRPTTHVLTIVSEGQIFVRDGVKSLDELSDWLRQQATTVKQPTLLVRAGAGVPAQILAAVLAKAHAAGFAVTLAVEEAKRPTDRR
jgi:biopolymer transport protein ExbD